MLAKYTKAIAAAVGGGVATAAGIWLGWSPEQITTQGTLIAGSIGTLLPFLSTLFSPKNAE